MTAYVNAYLDGRHLVLLRREENKIKATRELAEYSAFFRASDLTVRCERFLRGSRACSYKREGQWVRVGFRTRFEREAVCRSSDSPIVQASIQSYEADVDPVSRWLIDHDVKIAKPRRVYFDIETDSRVNLGQKEQMRILACSLIDDEKNKTQFCLSQDSDAAEYELLMQLWEAFRSYDQICAWNGDNFDFPMIWCRSEQRGCVVDARRWLWLDHMVLFRRMNMQSAESGEEKQSMKLGRIAEAFLGEGKDTFDVRKTYEAWAAGGEERDRLLRYNARDSELMQRLEQKTGYVALFQTLCDVCGIFPDSQGLNPTRQMDGFMMRLGKRDGYRFPTKKYRKPSELLEQYKGAYVMPLDTKGIERDVHVADFSGMYPSIIITWNMSPDTKWQKPQDAQNDAPLPANVCLSPLTGIHFRTDVRGILTRAVREMIDLRYEWNKKKDNFAPGTEESLDAGRRSTAYKVAANSFYGVVGSPYSRYFDKDIAQSVSQCGVWLIKKTIEEASRRGMHVIYGDTDSIFVKGTTKDAFAEFVRYCNDALYPPLLKEIGCVENHIKLAYEKAFSRIVFTSQKRYCGRYAHFKGKEALRTSKPEIKGLEYKRGDTVRLARELQGQVIDLLVGGLRIVSGDAPTEVLERYHEVLAAMRDRILFGVLATDDFVIGKSLSKPLCEYLPKIKIDGAYAALPAHVQVAKDLCTRGLVGTIKNDGELDVSEGTKIEYVVIDGSRTPIKVKALEDFAGGEDRIYVWESLVYPSTERLLEAAFPDHDWKAWAKVRLRPVRRVRQVHESQMAFDLPIGNKRYPQFLAMPCFKEVEDAKAE